MKAIKRYAALLLIFVCLFVGSALLALDYLFFGFIAIGAGIILTKVFDKKNLLPE